MKNASIKVEYKSQPAISRTRLCAYILVTRCTLAAMSSSTQPSTLRGTVNEYQPYG